MKLDRSEIVKFFHPVYLIVLFLCSGCADNPSHTSSQSELLGAQQSHFPGYAVKRSGGAKRAIVLVHGITGNGKSSWTSINGTYWPMLMKSDPAFEDVEVYVYEYPTHLFGNCLPVTDLANNLRLHLKNDRVFEDHEQVIFLAHSMGGLVVRQFLLRNRDSRDFIDKVPLALFFATPTGGSWRANVGNVLSTCQQVEDLRTIDVNSYLKSQQSDWLSSGLQERVISYCAFETKNFGGLPTVDRSSATSLCSRDPEALPTDHSDAVKPESVSDLPHIIVRNAMRDLPSANLPRLDPQQQNLELKKQVGDLKDRMDQRFRHRAIREHLGRFITEGNKILQAVFKGPPVPLPVNEMNDWYKRAILYLKENLDYSYEARFVAPDPGPSLSYNLPREHEDLIMAIKARLAVLRHFIEEMRD
jgi:pimeloyl-ACP methyl ester carboxylesterase